MFGYDRFLAATLRRRFVKDSSWDLVAQAQGKSRKLSRDSER